MKDALLKNLALCAWRFLLLLLLLVFTARPGAGQPARIILFDDEGAGRNYREASYGQAMGDAVLRLAGPDSTKMPLHAAQAYSGQESGLVEYRHGEGTWDLFVGTDGFQPLDLAGADTLLFYLNGPVPVPGTELPRLGLEDAEGRRTALLSLDLGGEIGLDAPRSGFQPGSTTDAAFTVRYQAVLPAEQARPGYPEDLLLTFADVPLDTSRAAIGAPATPARFTIETASGRQRLAFSFRDTDGDQTLSQPDEYIDILTPEAEGASLRPTWRVELDGAAPQHPPGEGDVYLLAVNNAGVDGDPATWQRVAVAFTDFGPAGDFDRTQVQAVRFASGGPTVEQRTLWVDYIAAVEAEGGAEAPDPPSGVEAAAGDESVLVQWTPVTGAAGYHVYRRDEPQAPFERRTATPVGTPYFADLAVENGRAYTYVVRTVGPGGVPSEDAAAVEATPQAGAPDVFIDLVARTAFDYFWQEANPSNGLVKDRSTDTSPASIAAVGFGLSALTVGIDRGWITRAEGAERVLTTLEFFWHSPQSTDPEATGYRGFYYHFLDMQTGRRVWNAELSTIDTALLMGGVVHAGAYFDGAGEGEARIRELAGALYERVEWDWAAVRPPLISHGWRPETGFLSFDWRGYNEAMILYILALGSPTHPVGPEAWEAWTSTYRWETHYGYAFVVFPPLFGHQYTHVWVDFRGIQDAYMREKGIDYFENSRRATLAQRAYAIDNPMGWEGYGADAWGFTASDVPGGYRARGAPPPQEDDGTLTPTAPGGSYAFTPEASRDALRHLYATYYAQLWGPYGFKDAINPSKGWVATDYLGIDQGPILLMIENERTGRIWQVFMQSPAVQRGLSSAGFAASTTAAEDPAVPAQPVLEGNRPNPFRAVTEIRYRLARSGPVALKVYDVMGREVATLVDQVQAAGSHTALFDASALASGVYFCSLQAEGTVKVRRMLRVR